MEAVLGIIGGSGLYDLPGIGTRRVAAGREPWGEPSDDILFAELGGLSCASSRATGAVIGCRPAASTTAPTSTR